MTIDDAKHESSKASLNPVYEAAVETAARGSLRTIDALLDADGTLRWILQILERTEQWTVRVRATELALYYATGEQLSEDEHGRLQDCLQRFECEVSARDVRLSEEEREQVAALDPYRCPGISEVPIDLSVWFGEVADEIREAQRSFQARPPAALPDCYGEFLERNPGAHKKPVNEQCKICNFAIPCYIERPRPLSEELSAWWREERRMQCKEKERRSSNAALTLMPLAERTDDEIRDRARELHGAEFIVEIDDDVPVDRYDDIVRVPAWIYINVDD